MPNTARFEDASPYDGDILDLPVADIDSAIDWYSTHFGMELLDRTESPTNRALLRRDGVQLGFAANGRDPSQNGAAITVPDAQSMRDDLESRGVEVANWRIDERDGERFQVFFVVAPDGLCYYFQQRLDEAT
jgi:catechol 2,3-dioxygenase-like lactoylglutathione lyase family enzyme